MTEESNTCTEALTPGAAACEQISTHCGDEISECFQCLKCTAGCPMAEHMDMPPAKIMRLLQLGQLDKVLESDAIWLCAGCLTCSTRCPNEIDVAHVLDKLRHEAMCRGIEPRNKKIANFHRGMLKSIRRHGRSYESGVLAGFAIKNGELMNNVGLGITMFLKGKMPMIPKNVSNRRAIRKMFERYQQKLAERKDG